MISTETLQFLDWLIAQQSVQFSAPDAKEVIRLTLQAQDEIRDALRETAD